MRQRLFRGNLSTSWTEVQPARSKLISLARHPAASFSTPNSIISIVRHENCPDILLWWRSGHGASRPRSSTVLPGSVFYVILGPYPFGPLAGGPVYFQAVTSNLI